MPSGLTGDVHVVIRPESVAIGLGQGSDAVVVGRSFYGHDQLVHAPCRGRLVLGGIDIPRAQAMDHVFGFMIYNDFSARAIQSREMAVGLGPAKGKDFVGGHVFG